MRFINSSLEVIVLVGVACFCVMLSSSPSSSQVMASSRSRYCGLALANILSFVCEGVYNTHTEQRSHKRYELDTDTVDNSDEMSDNYQSLRRLLSSDDVSNPMSYLVKRTAILRVVRNMGVSSECCDQPCTIHTLKSYCGSPSTQRP